MAVLFICSCYDISILILAYNRMHLIAVIYRSVHTCYLIYRTYSFKQLIYIILLHLQFVIILHTGISTASTSFCTFTVYYTFLLII